MPQGDDAMHRWFLQTALFLVAAHVVGSTRRAAAQDAWPLFRGGPQSQGVYRGSLPEKLTRRWQFRVPEGSFEATPTIAEGTVFIGDMDGTLYALDLQTGKQKWQWKNELGFVTAPAYRHERLYLGDIGGDFFCIDAKTGKPVWHFTTDAEINSSANFDAQHVLFGSQDATLYCLDQKTGKLIWKHVTADQIRCMPTIAADRCFVAGCDGAFHVIRRTDGKPLGEIAIDAPTGVTPAVKDDFVYFGHEGGVFFAVDWRSLKVVWKLEDERRRLPFRASPAVTDDRVVIAGHDKRVRALDRKTGEVKWTFTARGRFESSPVVCGNDVIIGGSDRRLYRLDLATGKKRWEYEVNGRFIGSPAVARGNVVIATDRGVVYCFGSP